MATLMVLEDVRAHFNVPVIVTSGARCKAYQQKLNPLAPHSKHVMEKIIGEAEAVDFVVRGVKTSVVRTYLNKRPYASLLGIGKYDTFVHADTRGVKARW